MREYTESLTPKQQLTIKAPTTVEQCLQILAENRSRKKAFSRILESFRFVIEPLGRMSGAIDVVVQTCSGIASPIWGPLRLAITVRQSGQSLKLIYQLLQVACEHFKTLERLTLMIDKIASSVRRYQDFELLFASHHDIRVAVGALYSDLVDFCVRVVRLHTKSFRLPFVSFDTQFGAISESIDLHSAEIDRTALAAHMKEAKEARERTAADKEGMIVVYLELQYFECSQSLYRTGLT